MFFQRTAATKCGPLFDLLSVYLEREEQPDAVSLARLRRDAAAVLLTPDVAQGHIICSGIAALVWNVEDAQRHVNEALRRDGSLDTLMNAMVTFETLGRPDLSLPYSLTAAHLAPSRPVVINEVSSVLVSLGRVGEAAKLQANCREVDHSATFEIDAGDLQDVMAVVGIDEPWLGEELAVIRSVFNDAKIRIRELSYTGEEDPDGGPSLAFEFGFVGTLEDEFRIEDEIAVRLAATASWNPTRLAVRAKYMETMDDAVVAC